MAKKNNKKSKPEETPVENIVNETPVENVTETPEVSPEEPAVEPTPEVEAEPEIAPEPEPAVEPEPEPVVEEKPKRVRAMTLKESFEKALETKPYVLFQNGVQLVRWKPNVRIDLQEDGFELNGHKYSYSGIEVRHV